MGVLRVFKFRLYPSRRQLLELDGQRFLAKQLWNELLAASKQHYKDFGFFLSRNSMQLMCKNYGLYSQAQQSVVFNLELAVKRFCKLKKQGKRVGFPRFKSVDRVKSLHYPQFGFRLEGKKLRVNPFGLIPVKHHRTIEGGIKNLTLKREASGKWFACFVVELPEKPAPVHGGKKVGIDLGLEKFATLSNGFVVANPRHLRKREEKLVLEQRRLSRKKRGSRNRGRQRLKVARVYERVSNSRKDFLHKTSHWLVNSFSLIALEDLRVASMVQNKQLSKSISDVSWSSFTGMLYYKAVEAGSTVVFVDAKNTTRQCSDCGLMVAKALSERVHECTCGLVLDRDLNAARNILIRATPGIGGSQALRDESSGVVGEERSPQL
ncbi:MAG TPA: RNA-guided endonuclease TnpB family protein [archaeon]|nr:RNA-guided endonuclease TnpB family protein [archaeon]